MTQDPPQQTKSFSATGRSCDIGIAGRPATPAHVAAKREPLTRGGVSMMKVKLRPWDGVALAESVLNDARKGGHSHPLSLSCFF